MIKGSCLCGEISFEAQEISGMVFNCHCSRCRKSHGSAFATQVFAVRDSLKFIKDHDLLKEYDSVGGIRTFCSACGSRLMNYGKDGGDYLSVAISAIDNQPELGASADCFSADKLAWVKLDESIEQFDEFPEL
jgi:hypothetical protein